MRNARRNRRSWSVSRLSKARHTRQTTPSWSTAARGGPMATPRPPAPQAHTPIDEPGIDNVDALDTHRFEHQRVGVRPAHVTVIIAGVELGLTVEVIVDDRGLVIVPTERRKQPPQKPRHRRPVRDKTRGDDD